MPRLFKGNAEVRLTGKHIEIESGSIPFCSESIVFQIFLVVLMNKRDEKLFAETPFHYRLNFRIKSILIGCK